MTHATVSFTPESTRRVLVAACRAAGLDPAGASLMRLGENALFRLRSAPVVVRIARNMSHWETAVKEVSVARWLATENFAAGRVAKPTDQPIAVGEHPVTFWELIPGQPAMPEDVSSLGRVLLAFHRLPHPEAFSIPALDVLARVNRRVNSAEIPSRDKEFLLERCTELREDISQLNYPLESTVIHGDAHIKNLMMENGNPILIDFENVAWGQPEWDLSMTATEYLTAGWWNAEQYASFSEAYGFDIRDWSGFATLQATHEIKMTTWVMQNISQSQKIASEFETRMEKIRYRSTSAKWSPM
ncbi:aminoglycoside phosphotransferase family protein [Amycolatopsis ultiminotia]|uniref:Aminoglycoside phosphotransferase family protein n=1 Tax=Amycolatopsis ultiminotia TaxID=543629 RepID=A0ABP6WJK8_9PSEU